MPVVNKIGGRFGGILLPILATAEFQMLAMAMRKVKVVNEAKAGAAARLTPLRVFPGTHCY